jgi:hypothetical protein
MNISEELIASVYRVADGFLKIEAVRSSEKLVPTTVSRTRKNITMLLFWVLTPCRLVVDTNVSEKHTVSIFRVEVAVLGSGGIFLDSDSPLSPNPPFF